jgi:protein TonB
MGMDDKRYKQRFWESCAVSLGLHLLVFVAGYIGLSTKAEYGMEGSRVSSPAVKPAPPLEIEVVDLLPSEEAEAPRERPKPTPQPVSQASAPTTSSGQAYEIPSYRLNPPPPYPEEARKAGLEGKLLIQASVDAKGDVTGVKLLAGSGHAVLDESALRTVEKWKFKPARLAGIAIATEINVPIVFRLKGP